MTIRRPCIQLATVIIVIGFMGTAAAFDVGPLRVGGAIRANYTIGDYDTGVDGPSRGGHGGNFELDVFRVNLDYSQGAWVAKGEYRWYDGYNFAHTLWGGYNLSNGGQIQVGLNRAPFGVGPYGAANSWFFSQSYYVGLSDNMKLGIKYSLPIKNWNIDVAYYACPAPNGRGTSSDSARYSYDIVDNGSTYSHYRERNQVNFRAIYSLKDIIVPTDLGCSLQWGELKADKEYADDSDAIAGAIHAKSTLGNWGLKLQLTKYSYDAKYKHGSEVDAQGNPIPITDDLITMGAYDFAWPVASEGLIPSAALSYTWKPASIEWIDSITFYNDYSIIIKDGQTAAGQDFNDSAMNVTGMAIAHDGWYIYVDYAYSDGNYFVGNDGDSYGDTYADSEVGDFGANKNNKWNGRFNINFGYYF